MFYLKYISDSYIRLEYMTLQKRTFQQMHLIKALYTQLVPLHKSQIFHHRFYLDFYNINRPMYCNFENVCMSI